MPSGITRGELKIRIDFLGPIQTQVMRLTVDGHDTAGVSIQRVYGIDEIAGDFSATSPYR